MKNWQNEIDKAHKGQTGYFKELEKDMKTSHTVYPDNAITDFTAHQIYIHNLCNKIRGYSNQLVSNKIEFPKASQSKNKFKS